jgi:hypothetical protein
LQTSIQTASAAATSADAHASAASAAATITTATTATAAAVVTTAASAAAVTTAGSAVSAGTGFRDRYGALFQTFTVQTGNCGFRGGFRSHFHEPKTLGTAALSITGDTHRSHFAKCGKCLSQFVLHDIIR